MSAAATAEELLSRSPERGGIGLDLQQLQFDEDVHQRAASLYEEDFSTSWTRGCPSLSQIKPPHRPSPSRKLWISWLPICMSTDSPCSNAGGTRPTKFLTAYRTRATNVFCNSETDVEAAGLSKINGFPYQCPRAEGKQATLNPFDNERQCEWVYSDCLHQPL